MTSQICSIQHLGARFAPTAALWLQRAWVALGGFGLASYALLGGWLTAKEADKPYMAKVQLCVLDCSDA